MLKIINICEAAAEKIDNAELKDLCFKIRGFYDEGLNHKPTMTLLAYENLNILGKFMGIEVPENFAEQFKSKHSCVIFNYSEEPEIINEENILYIELPSEILKSYRIIICNNIKSKREWLEISCETDIACLLTNATMVMNLTEKEWLKEYGTFFEPDSLILSIFNMNILNTEEDYVSVRDRVNKTLHELGINFKVFEVPSEAIEYMKEFLDETTLSEKRKFRSVRNCLSAIRNKVEELSIEIFNEGQSLNEIVSKIKKNQDFLESAGKYTADIIFYNAMVALKSEADNGVRDYGSQIYESIKQTVEAAQIQNLEFIDEKIDIYIRKSWEYYLEEIGKKFDIEQKKVIDKISSQIEADVDSFISDLDEESRKAVYEALTSREFEIVINTIEPEIKTTFYVSEASEVVDRLKRETKNMMLLSIPLFFLANPFLAVGNIFASKLIEKVRMGKSTDEIKEQIIKQAEKVCSLGAEEILRELHSKVDQETEKSKIDIKEAYKILIDRIVKELLTMKEKQQTIVDIKKILEEIIEEVKKCPTMKV